MEQTSSVMKPLLGVCGPSGSGKSSALENLPSGTVIFDFERKGFPYDPVKQGHRVRPFGEEMLATDCMKNTATAYPRFRKEFKAVVDTKPPVIVLEGFLKLTQFIHGYSETMHKGYDAFKYYNKWIRDTVEFLKNPHSIIIITGINELVTGEGVEDGEKAEKHINCFAVCTGKEMRGKIEQDMLVVLHTHVKTHKEQANQHFFMTQSDGINTAKSPTWMKLPKLVPNDLGPIVKQLQDYYGGAK